MADCCETFLSFFFFYVILWKRNVERLNINRPYYQYLGRLRSRRGKRGVEWGGGGVGSKKEKKEGGKKRRGDPFFSFLHSTPSTPLAPATQASVWGIL